MYNNCCCQWFLIFYSLVTEKCSFYVTFKLDISNILIIQNYVVENYIFAKMIVNRVIYGKKLFYFMKPAHTILDL